MKALTLTQPWATMVAIGAKAIETRSWSTPHRGWLAIHAGATYAPLRELDLPGTLNGVDQLVRQHEHFWRPLVSAGYVDQLRLDDGDDPATCVDVTKLPAGAIVAVVWLEDVWPTENLTGGRPDVVAPHLARLGVRFGTYEGRLGDYTSGRYAWLLRDVMRIDPPVAATGGRQLWDVPGDVVGQLRDRASRRARA
jgi:hypothetical protein